MAAGDEAENGRQTSISPAELREALSAMDKGKAAKQFELSDMHDASEVGSGLLSFKL